MSTVRSTQTAFSGRVFSVAIDRVLLPKGLERDIEVVRQRRLDGAAFVYGDASRPETLRRLGVSGARALVVTTDDGLAAEHIVATARKEGPDLVILARGRDADHAMGLLDRVADEEQALLAYARERLGAIEEFEHYRIWPSDHPRVGLLTFNLRGIPYDLLAAILSCEHGIGIRHGCFCAHPLMMRLLRVDDAEAHRLLEETRAGHHERLPGAARMSLGLGSTREDVDAFADALRAIAAGGPTWTYAVDPHTDQWEPDPDPRPLPPLGVRLVEHPHGHGESA